MRAPLAFSAVFVFFLLLDQLLVRHVAPPKARYFCLHVVFNSWIIYTCLSNALDALLNPTQAMLGDNASTPSENYYTFTYLQGAGFTDSQVISTAGIAAFHLYHALFFDGIAKEDWIHHIVSCGIVPAIGINVPFAKVVDVCNVGMCGIPGGIDYFLLALQRCGPNFSFCAPTKLVQKRVSALNNLLLRWPLMLLATYMYVLGWSNGTLATASTVGAHSLVRWLGGLGCFLHTGNAAYYAHKVIGNYHVVKAAATEKVE